jgi:hypothetical protein
MVGPDAGFPAALVLTADACASGVATAGLVASERGAVESALSEQAARSEAAERRRKAVRILRLRSFWRFEFGRGVPHAG